MLVLMLLVQNYLDYNPYSITNYTSDSSRNTAVGGIFLHLELRVTQTIPNKYRHPIHFIMNVVTQFIQYETCDTIINCSLNCII